MARLKNALRGHFVGEFDPKNPKTEPKTYLELAKWSIYYYTTIGSRV